MISHILSISRMILNSYKFKGRKLGQCIIILCLLFVGTNLSSQSKAQLDELLRDGKEVPQILFVGTFHFGYPGLDSHVTEDKYKVDIKSPERQKEVEELVDYIAKYKPTKIMVEADKSTSYLIDMYKKWKQGKSELRKREIDQIAFRLMNQFDLDTLYGIDATSMYNDLYNTKDSVFGKSILERIDTERPDSLYENVFYDKYWEWYEFGDKKCVEMHLLNYFKEANTDHHINRMHGHYILSSKTTDYNDVDRLAINWYSRNLRIMKNIQMIHTNPNDRIMILIGSGHVATLMQQFVSNPEYEVIKFGELEIN